MSVGQVAAWMIVGAGMPTAVAPDPASATVERLVERFNAARAGYDNVALAATLAPDYQEISPIGDVDDRAKVLGFYRAEDRRPVPVMQSDERSIVLRGTTGVETERLSFTIPRPDGTSMTRSIRVRYVATKLRDGWKLVSAQYTPIPPAK